MPGSSESNLEELRLTMDVVVRFAVRCGRRCFAVPAGTFPGEAVIAAVALGDCLGLETVDAIDLLHKGGMAFDLPGEISVCAFAEEYFAEVLHCRWPGSKFPGSIYATSSCFNAYVEDEKLSLAQIRSVLRGDNLRLYFLVTGDAGEPEELRGAVPKTTFCFHSNECGSHHLPHVHVCYDNRFEWSMSILTGEVLAGGADYDKVPGKIRRKIHKVIDEKRPILLGMWKNLTNGIKFDVDGEIGQIDCRGLS